MWTEFDGEPLVASRQGKAAKQPPKPKYAGRDILQRQGKTSAF
jgi:hypothetical protein